MTNPSEPFVVKHYVGEPWPMLKGNGFDGITIMLSRDEAQQFVDWINARLALSDPFTQLLDQDGVEADD